MRKRIIKLLILVMCVGTLACCSSCGRELESYRPIEDVNNLDGRKIGVALGWATDYILTERDGKDLTLLRYDTNADMLMALCYKQIDAMAMDGACCKLVQLAQPGLKVVKEPVSSVGYDIYVAKQREDVYKKLNGYIKECRSNGILDEFAAKLDAFDGENYEWPQGLKQTGTGEKLRVAYLDQDYPYTFVTPDGQHRGLELEFLIAFANKYNYQLELIPSVEEDIYNGMDVGMYDIGVAAMADVFAQEAKNVGVHVTDTYLYENIYLIEIGDPDVLTEGEKLDF